MFRLTFLFIIAFFLIITQKKISGIEKNLDKIFDDAEDSVNDDLVNLKNGGQ